MMNCIFWSTHRLCLINVKKLTTDQSCKMQTSQGWFIFACCCSKTSVVALLLMFCREWWLLLLADNSTTTFLMLTGLHIHLSALRVCLSRFFMSLFQGHHRHSHRSFPPVVLCSRNQLCSNTFGFYPRTPKHSCMVSCVTVTKLPVNNCDKIPMERKKSNKISRQRNYDANTRVSAATQTTASNSSIRQI